jgi:hypothetical protein
MDQFSIVTSCRVSDETSDRLNRMSENSLRSLSEDTRNTIRELNRSVAELRPPISRSSADFLRKRYNTVLDNNAIIDCRSTRDLQLLKGRTCDLLMSNPTLNKLYKRNNIHGWNHERDDIIDHLNYKRITSGVGGLDGESYNIVNYADNHKHKLDISLKEKNSLLDSMNMAMAAIFVDEVDPTSPYNGTF